MPKEIKKVEKVGYKCHECGEVLRRKTTEPAPRSCNYCHTENPAFTKVNPFPVGSGTSWDREWQERGKDHP